jgi:DEAD/DEAH box helicase domain-containing protein
VVGFKKIRFHTGENVGAGELRMPEQEMHTTAWWLTLPRAVMAALPYGSDQRRDGVVGLAHALGHLAALFLMCDRHDLGVAVGEGGQADALLEHGGPRPAPARAGDAYEPRIFIYDNYPGGMGMSEPLFRLRAQLLAQARALIATCPCREGCPACTGPAGEGGSAAKDVALALLDAIGCNGDGNDTVDGNGATAAQRHQA